MNNEKKFSTHVLAGVAMLSALAFVLQYLEFPIPIIPPFIKFDFSDLPAIIGAFCYGPLSGVIIEFIKNLLHCAVSQSATVGELSNFLLGAVYVICAGMIYKHNKSKRSALVGGIIGALIMAAASFPINLYIVYPFYYNFMPKETVLAAYQAILPAIDSIEKSLIVFNVPFTFVKGLLCALISMPVYKPLRRIIKK